MSVDLQDNPNQIYDDEERARLLQQKEMEAAYSDDGLYVDDPRYESSQVSDNELMDIANSGRSDYQSSSLSDQELLDVANSSGRKSGREEFTDNAIEELRKLEEETGLGNNVRANKLGIKDRDMKSLSEALREAEDRRRNGENWNDADSFYKENKNTGKRGPRGLVALVDNKRKKFVASTLTLAVASTVFGVIGMSAGPAKFIFLGDTLEKGHFWTQEDMSAIRMYKLMRNVRYAIKSPEKLRLSSLQNLMTKPVDARMKQSGFDIELSDRLAQNKAIVFDVDKVDPTNRLAELKGKSPDQILEHFKTNYGMDGVVEGDLIKFSTSVEDLSPREINKVYRSVLKATGYHRLSGPGRARLLTKRGGSPGMLHPIKKADEAILRKVDEKLRFGEWQKKIGKKFKDGVKKGKATFASKKETTTDADGNTTDATDPDLDSAASTADDVGNINPDAPDASTGVESKLSGIGNNAALRKAGAVTAVAGVVCLAQAISNDIDNIRQNNLVLPLMRLGMEMISLRYQIQAGEDVNLNQLKYHSKQLANETADATKNWANDKSLQFERGFAKLTGRDIPDSIQYDPSRNPVSKFLNGVPGLSGACGVLGSPFGTIATMAIDIGTGPVSAVVGLVASELFAGPAIQGLSNWIAGDQVNLGLLRASAFAGASNYGARFAANESMAAAGGAELSPEVAMENRQEKLAIQHEEFSKKSLAQRLFDTTDSSSLVGQVAMATPGSSLGMVQTLSTSLTRPFTMVGSTFSGIMSTSLFADEAKDSYDYGFPEIGYSYSQVNDPSLDNPYKNAEEVRTILSSSRGQDYIDRAKECFNISIDKDGNVSSKASTVMYAKIIDNEECGANSGTASLNVANQKYASTKPVTGEVRGATTDKNWLKVRMLIFDTQLLESAACIEGVDDKSCDNLAMSTSGATATVSAPQAAESVPADVVDPAKLGYNSKDTACAQGSNDLGNVKSRYTGALKKEEGALEIKLCQIPDLPGGGQDTTGKKISGGIVVNSTVSGAWVALARKAKADGVSLSAGSSFRLADSCGGTGNGKLCAAPGKSMHQTGYAVDMANMSGTGGSTCASRARLPNNKGWKWMDDNAPKFGIKQYSLEAWHWDSGPTDSRCGTGE